MNDVAERVGLGKASLFHHFATKDALYEAVLDRVVASLNEPLLAIYASGGTYPERLRSLTYTLTRALGARPYAARLLLRETMDWGPLMRGKLVDRLVTVLEAGAAWIRAGQSEHVFAPGDARQLVLSILGMHLVPFTIEHVVERFVGTSCFDPKFIEDRASQLALQAERLHVVR
jgi:AcrR family transcriptional regulator